MPGRLMTDMAELVIVQPGQKLPAMDDVQGDFADWMLRGMSVVPQCAARRYPHLGDALPPIETVSAAVVTGSGAMVTDGDEWADSLADWLRQLSAAGVPLLGICFGHQVLAHALGGRVGDNPNGIEVGTVTTRLTPDAIDDPLFRDLPSEFPVQASHRQSVLTPPSGATVLASSAKDRCHAYRVGDRVWGIQFHPEFDDNIVRAYIDYYRPSLADQQQDADALQRTVQATPTGSVLLRRFGELFTRRT